MPKVDLRKEKYDDPCHGVKFLFMKIDKIGAMMEIILIVTVPCKELEIKKREKAKMKIEEGDDEQRWFK